MKKDKFKCIECGRDLLLKKPKTMGDRFRFHRLKRGYGLRELARELKISPTSITRIEQGFTNVHFDKIIKLRNFFDVSMDYILDGIEK